ncbi:12548_t:CDS:2 [Entrophospora sp. SA101]|nr:12548_t:CDS:2 [Entrophospora sp. SA101]
MKRKTFLIFEGVTVLELEDRQISICATTTLSWIIRDEKDYLVVKSIQTTCVYLELPSP